MELVASEGEPVGEGRRGVGHLSPPTPCGALYSACMELKQITFQNGTIMNYCKNFLDLGYIYELFSSY